MTLSGLAGALLLGAVLLIATAFRVRRRPVVGTTVGLTGVTALALASSLAVLSVSVQGYEALTREEVAATLRTKPLGDQLFLAELVRPDGSREEFQIEGDQLYMDARILKWKPWANLLGLHTAYQLDRIGGRYAALADELDKERSLFALAEERPVDAFTLRQQHAWLAPVVDAEYGSATFIAADRPALFEVRVSTTGLLIREVPRQAAARP
jgi:hypothetical protein